MVVRSSTRAPREIVVKVLLNADEFIPFNKCVEEAGGSHSSIGRQLFNQFVHAMNSRRQMLVQEWSEVGQVMAIPGNFGSRLHFGPAPACLSP